MPDVSSNNSADFRIYMSSTLDDLREERAAAIDVLRHYRLVIYSYRAGPRPTPENCLADVRASQVYVLILGMRYGWLPGGESDPNAVSLTEWSTTPAGRTIRSRFHALYSNAQRTRRNLPTMRSIQQRRSAGDASAGAPPASSKPTNSTISANSGKCFGSQ